MIKAKALRIGNIVYDTRTVDRSLALPPILTLARVKKTSEFYDFEYYEPVPITPEILKKFGFEEQGWYNINEYEYEFIFSIRYQETDYKVCFVKKTYGGDIEQSIRFKQDHDIIYLKKPLQFVHHLQNLFLDFTHEEIIFN